MDSHMPDPDDLKDLSITRLGKPAIASPLKRLKHLYVSDRDKVFVYPDYQTNQAYWSRGQTPPFFEMAGPRNPIFFDPQKLTCGIIVSGGLCPGINDVIRTVALSLMWQYGVKRVLGFHYGFEGLTSKAPVKPTVMTSGVVDEIQHQGGTILGSSRGQQDPREIVETLVKQKIGILFVIGGDGSLRGAHALAQEIQKRRLKISVVGVPKTIDNDIYCVQRTFGLSSAVEEARKAIYAAHEEAKAAFNGIGLVKLMGRDAGFIAAYATLANSDVNFCFIPEIPFKLDGKDGFLGWLEERLRHKHHAVIVVAEGAGQDLIDGRVSRPYIPTTRKDNSGNIRYKDIGLFLKDKIQEYFKHKKIALTLKYIDPSYTIRSCPADSDDAAFCLMLGQHAVHAAMSGRTDMVVSFWNHYFAHVPLAVVVRRRKQIDPNGNLWQTLLETTGQMGRCWR